MINISIVEDDNEIRESLAILINGTPGFSCFSTFYNCEAAIKGILDDPPDVILMDISLPGMSGIEGIRRIKSKVPDIDILILTVHSDSKRVFEALCAGACGYLIKDTPPARLLEAIAEAHAGGAPDRSHGGRFVQDQLPQRSDASRNRSAQSIM